MGKLGNSAIRNIFFHKNIQLDAASVVAASAAGNPLLLRTVTGAPVPVTNKLTATLKTDFAGASVPVAKGTAKGASFFIAGLLITTTAVTAATHLNEDFKDKITGLFSNSALMDHINDKSVHIDSGDIVGHINWYLFGTGQGTIAKTGKWTREALVSDIWTNVVNKFKTQWNQDDITALWTTHWGEIDAMIGKFLENQKAVSTTKPPSTQAPTQAPTEGTTQAPTEAPTQIPTEGTTQAPTEGSTQTPASIVVHSWKSVKVKTAYNSTQVNINMLGQNVSAIRWSFVGADKVTYTFYTATLNDGKTYHVRSNNLNRALNADEQYRWYLEKLRRQAQENTTGEDTTYTPPATTEPPVTFVPPQTTGEPPVTFYPPATTEPPVTFVPPQTTGEPPVTFVPPTETEESTVTFVPPQETEETVIFAPAETSTEAEVEFSESATTESQVTFTPAETSTSGTSFEESTTRTTNGFTPAETTTEGAASFAPAGDNDGDVDFTPAESEESDVQFNGVSFQGASKINSGVATLTGLNANTKAYHDGQGNVVMRNNVSRDTWRALESGKLRFIDGAFVKKDGTTTNIGTYAHPDTKMV